MNQNTISPDDPRLTAYALGEMDAAERTEFEQLLAQDAAARAAVQEISATAQALGSALETESAIDANAAAPDFAKAAILPGREPSVLDGGKRKILRFPQLYFIVSSAAAACFALVFAYWQHNHELDEKQKQYMEVALQEKSAADVATRQEEAEKVAAAAVERRSKMRELAVALPVAPAPADSLLNPESVPVAADASGRADKDERVMLSPFRVASASQAGYGAAVAKSARAQPPVAGDLQFMADVAATDSGNRVVQYKREKLQAPVAPNDLLTPAPQPESEFNTEAYARRNDNPFLRVAQNPLSTFSIDVDTASYANVRRILTQGHQPPPDAVRIEELVNYFPYHYTPPTGNVPFAASLEVASAPWTPEHRLVRIGLKGREISDAARPRVNLVFLLDVSGSMDEPNKLPLVKQSMKMLVNKLRDDDRVAIVVYAGASGMALPSTSAREKTKILNAIDVLQPGGSTNGEAGIQLAYDIAKANFVTGGVNRVILATDGDFNVGTTNEGELTRLVEEKAKSGVFLTVLGFGMGNYKDSTLEQLADKGNGNYAYIDTAQEAKKALVEQAGGTLVTIAKDVKIQVEFNPAQVAAYRLIGYENRMLRAEDFNNDKIDAGEIGAGHTVTALYEVVPAGVTLPDTGGAVDALKYQKTEDRGPKANNGELLTVKIRYKEPAGDVSSKLEFPLRDAGLAFEQASPDFKFAASVAAFGMILRESPHKGTATLANVTSWAQAGLENDAGGYRSEFLGLVKQAEAIRN